MSNLNEVSDAVLVTLVIYNGPSQESLNLLFTSYPTTADIQNQLGEDKYLGLIDSCEVSAIEDYQVDFMTSESESISFDCLDASSKCVGAIHVTRMVVAPSSLAELE